MRKLAAVLVPLLLLAIVIGSIGCGNGEGEVEGQPIWNVGDKWVVGVVTEGFEHIRTVEVVGEGVVDGKDCYVTEILLEPSFIGMMDFSTVEYDKATMRMVREQMVMKILGLSVVLVASYSYSPDETLYPLEVGKEIEVTETEIAVYTALGYTDTKTKTRIYSYKVVGVEQVTVPAGTFECFKIVMFGDDGSARQIQWHSDEVKGVVKKASYKTGEVSEELISYTLR